METKSTNRCFGGTQGVYTHTSAATGTDMTFALFLPEEAATGPVPLLWFLSGLTCTHENAMTKAGAQQWCAAQSIAVVFPDTSPRGEGVANDDAYDMGQGAGFYIDATEDPWKPHFQMESYITRDLTDLLAAEFPLDMDRQAITGHSMGGHGALTLAMKHPGRYRSASAFSPICHPAASDWGRKQFTGYLGADADWTGHDATLLMQSNGFDGPLLVDQGTDDQFYDLLNTSDFAAACAQRRQDATIRLQKGYDHSYFFIASFIEEHVDFHAQALYA
ncbi:S-formylglutathione hydrolase [Loktanella salsilacus]|uniref:S-formylglutathione hydrolase n=1 Tax=Loktanella salsilacus TaxID=195913 RepID=UPI0020B796E6|nr:S-formylglutathione hydrolase [Loktanella salsilacus]UTH43838.1 S-formylglutathione hydrolase [Loktanella salsilacus]